MHMMSGFENMDVLLANENVNPIERELANTINGSISNKGVESDWHFRGNSSNENEVRDFSHGTTIPRQDCNLESMKIFSNEIILRLSQEMVAMMSMMHSQINRSISSTISERVIPESQNIMNSMSSMNRDTESGSSSNIQEKSNETTVFLSKIAKKDCRSAYDLRDTENLSPLTFGFFYFNETSGTFELLNSSRFMLSGRELNRV